MAEETLYYMCEDCDLVFNKDDSAHLGEMQEFDACPRCAHPMTEDPVNRVTMAHKQGAWLRDLNASGYAGMLPGGEIVDRRNHPEAIAIQSNSMLGIVKPKKLPDGDDKR